MECRVIERVTCSTKIVWPHSKCQKVYMSKVVMWGARG